MSIEIIDKLKQKNNGTFKLIDLEDVDYDGTGASTKDKIEELADKQITLEKDDTSFNGVDDTIHDNLTTTDKRIIGAINEVNAQFKDIAKQTITEEERTKLTNLENYDDTSIKNDIQTQKARIDTFTTLQEGSTTGDAELIDARVGADGRTYSNIGDSIRSQIGGYKEKDELSYNLNCINEVIADTRNGSAFTSPTLTIPIGQTGNGSYIATRIRSNIASVKGKTVICKIKFSCNDELKNKLTTKFANDNTGVTLIKSDIDITNCIVTYIFNVTENSNATWIILGLTNTNAYTYTENKNITIVEYNTSLYYSKDIIQQKINDSIINKADIKYVDRLINLSDVISPINGFVSSVKNGATFNKDTLTIPIGQTGNGSYFGIRIMKSISSVLGKTIIQKIKFSYNNSSIKNRFEARFITNGTGTTLVSSSIDFENNEATFKYTVDINTTATYIITALNITNSYTYSTDANIKIDSYNSEIVYDSISEAIPSKTGNHLVGKKMFCIGHSMTHMEKWQSTVVNDLQLSGYTINAVYGGTLVSQYLDVHDTDKTADIITVWYDTNDWRTNKKLGTISDAIVDDGEVTFYGALKYVCQWLSSNIPTAKVILISSPKRFDCSDFATQYGVNDKGYEYNANGDTLEDFSNAIGEVARLSSFRFKDLFHTSGINKYNAPSYLNTDLLHPNDFGGVNIGHQISAELKLT